MRRVFAFFLAAGCVRPSIAPVVDVGGPTDLPAIEPLGTDPTPIVPDDLVMEIALPENAYAATILPDGRVRYRTPNAQGCAGGLSREVIAALFGIAQRIGFWSMKSEYPAVPPGLSLGYRVTVRARGEQKTVVHFTSEHAAVVHGDLKGQPDIGDRLRLTELEDALAKAVHFDSITLTRSIDLDHRGPDSAAAAWRMEDALVAISIGCGALRATAVQLNLRADGTVASTAAIPGGALSGCPDEILRAMSFGLLCSGSNVLFVVSAGRVDGEGLHAEVHSITPNE